MTQATGPLAGLKVIELGQLIAGPFAAKTLADFGAEVIKIEAPGSGDPLRQWRLLKDGTSVWWQVQSRNKKSVSMDLRRPEAQEIIRRLVKEADVLIENFRPGTLEGWGLGWEELHAINPGLIMLRISGYGQTGPYRDRPGFGVIGEAMGGLRYLTSEPGRTPVRVGVWVVGLNLLLNLTLIWPFAEVGLIFVDSAEPGRFARAMISFADLESVVRALMNELHGTV